MIVLGIVLLVLLLLLAAAYLCYRLAFSVPKQRPEALFDMPETGQYAPYRATARQMIEDALAVPFEPVSTRSFDGLKLCGKCYFTSASAPWLLMFHGYRSQAERDFCGGLRFGIDAGYNVLLVDQRAHGQSEGRCLTFGIKERRDCLSWVGYILSRAGADAQIVLYGMSMGAATVLMAAGMNLPKNVTAIVADCGYSAPSEIIKQVIRKMHAPLFLTYALVRLGGWLFGGFDLEEADAGSAMAACDIPVLFIHGGDDRFVPCEMSRRNFERCRAAGKRLLIVPGAGHGMSYMADKAAYLGAVSEFLGIGK